MNFHFSAFPELSTERLLLRNYLEEDYPTVLFLRSDPEVNKFIKRDPPLNIEEAIAFVHKVQNGMKNGKNINWVICRKEDAVMIGSVCLWNFSDNGKTGELGYDLHPDHQNRGFMNEAVQGVLNYGFTQLGFLNITAYTHKFNERSIQLLKKNKFSIRFDERDPDNENNLILSLNKESFLSGNVMNSNQ